MKGKRSAPVSITTNTYNINNKSKESNKSNKKREVESKSNKRLTPKQEVFCQEYLVDLNATQAAIRAGYSKNGAEATGSKLLINHKVQAEISRLMSVREKRTDITADKTLNELALLGFSDIKNYVDVNAAGLVKVKDLSTLPPELSRAIKKVKQKTSIRFDDQGGKIQDAHLEFELYDKLLALDKIGTHLGMFKLNVNHKHSGEVKTDGVLEIRVIDPETEDKAGGNE